MNLRQRSAREEPEINLISLVDVVLLLLIFFMLTTSFVRQSQLAVRLPEADAVPVTTAAEPALEVTVSERGEFYVNGRALVDARAETLAAAIRRVTPEPAAVGEVTISADAGARHQDVVTAMDVVGRLGFAEVRIATVRPRTP